MEDQKNFILTKTSIMVCPHGGMVMHMPTSVREFRIVDEAVLLATDLYIVTGCGNTEDPCREVHWDRASEKLFVGINPVLVHTSVGIPTSVSGIPRDPVRISLHQHQVIEPEELTIED